MSDFLKKFLIEDPRRFSANGRFVALAAFGKHPGWDDHVEDLGLETEALNFAKLVLYVNGIGGQIDSGAWEKLDPAQQLPGFKHLFVWQRMGQILIGRMWSSSDGKGRKRYPMVVCLHFMGVSLGWALKQALPALADLEAGCLATTSATEVRALLARKRAALREAVQSADGKSEYAPVSPDSLNEILRPGDPAHVEGFLRVLYQIESQLGGFSPGVFNVRAGPSSVLVQQIRVPAAAPNPELSLLFWTRFFLVYVDPLVPLLLTLPLETDWVDVTLGEPESRELFSLRATPKAVPKVSEVPYKLDDQFRSKAQAFLDGFRRGENSRPDLKPAAAPAIPAPKAGKSGLLKWLGAGLVVILAAFAALQLLPKADRQPSAAAPPSVASETSKNKTNLQNLAAVQPDDTTAAKAKSDLEAQAEATRLAQEKKKSDAVAAATRLKAETEAAAKEKERQKAEAAIKEKERQLAEAAEKERQLALAAAKEKERQIAEAKERERLAAEAARIEAQKQAALQKELEQQRKAAEMAAAAKAQPADQPAAAKVELASTSSSPAAPPGTASAILAVGGPGGSQMTNSIGMVLILLPSGMWVGKYEVTQAEYSQVMKANPSNPRWLNERQPVEQVTWNDAVEFTRRLNELEKGQLPAGKIYSLPTEKQWKEFAADQKFEELPGGTAMRKDPLPVGQSNAANKFGLFDVLGNIWEWCLDDAPGDQKLLKGGAFNSNNYDRTLRADAKSLSCGFRCVLISIENH